MDSNLTTPTGSRQQHFTNPQHPDPCRRIRQCVAEVEIESLIRNLPHCPRQASLRVDRLVLMVEGWQ